MVGELATTMLNRYTSDPTERVYQSLKALFLHGGESGQELLQHGAEWIGPSGRIEFMTLIENCPRFAQEWSDGCCWAFERDRPFATIWRTTATLWRPADGAEALDAACSVETNMDEDPRKLKITVRTPIVAVRELAAYTK